MNIRIRTILLGVLSIGFAQSHAQTFALQVKDNQITYLTDGQGNRILDFSTCGYQASEQDIPSIRNVVFVPWKAGDNTARNKAGDGRTCLFQETGFESAVPPRSGMTATYQQSTVHLDTSVGNGYFRLSRERP